MLVEVNCESDFVARTDDFKELVHDVAMHIAASDPKFIRKEDVTPEAFEQRERYLPRAGGRDWQTAECGRKDRRRQDEQVLRGSLPPEQPFIKDQTINMSQLIATKIGKLGENISVRRFARFKVGDAGATIAISNQRRKANKKRAASSALFCRTRYDTSKRKSIMTTPVFKRILLKLSGEALAASQGFGVDPIESMKSPPS